LCLVPDPRREPRQRFGTECSQRGGRRRRSVVAGICGCLLVLAAACGGDDRPSDEAWRREWERRQELIPDVDAIIDGGSDFCGELLGEFRVELTQLLPSPSEVLDEAVQAWIDHADTIAFECPSDRADLAERMRQLDLLAAEIDAGLEADAGG
jgi:hypothetical protein